MKTLKCCATLLLVVTLAGCSTIDFRNGGAPPTSYGYGNIHHIGIFDLVEFSDPFDLDRACRGQGWQSVRTEKTFLNGLIGAFTLGFYGPWQVRYKCK